MAIERELYGLALFLAILSLVAMLCIAILLVLVLVSQRWATEQSKRQQCADCRIRYLADRMISCRDFPPHERRELADLCSSDSDSDLKLCA